MQNVPATPADAECHAIQLTAGGPGKMQVAAVVGPREMERFIRNLYGDGLGNAPVVVYNIELDDIVGHCERDKMSPIIRAIATGKISP